MLGIIYSLAERNDKGYRRLVIVANTPYARNWFKFNLWGLKKIEGIIGPCSNWDGKRISFTMDKDSQFPRLETIAPMDHTECVLCHGYFEPSENEQERCGSCDEIDKKDRCTEEILELVRKSEKKQQYGMSILLTFADPDENTYSSCIFDNSPLYDDVKGLKPGEKYQLKGWIKEKYVGGLLEGDKYIVELDFCPEEI